MKDAIEIFTDIIGASIPFATAFWMGELIVRSFITMAFRGRIEF